MQGEIRKIHNPLEFALLAAEGYMFDCEERAGLSVFSPEVKVQAKEDGIFTLEGPGDEILLEIASYLNIISFWDEFELIRDYSYIKNPVIFTGLGEEYIELLEKIDCEALEGREVYFLVASQENFEKIEFF